MLKVFINRHNERGSIAIVRRRGSHRQQYIANNADVNTAISPRPTTLPGTSKSALSAPSIITTATAHDVYDYRHAINSSGNALVLVHLRIINQFISVDFNMAYSQYIRQHLLQSGFAMYQIFHFELPTLKTTYKNRRRQ